MSKWPACSDCGLPIEDDQEEVVIQPDFVVHKTCLDAVEEDWKDMKQALRAQGIDPDHCDFFEFERPGLTNGSS